MPHGGIIGRVDRRKDDAERGRKSKVKGMVSRNVVKKGPLIHTEPIRIKGKVVKVQRVQLHLEANVPVPRMLGSTT